MYRFHFILICFIPLLLGSQENKTEFLLFFSRDNSARVGVIHNSTTTKLTVTDNKKNRIYDETLKDGNPYFKYIDLSTLPDGTYYFELKNKDLARAKVVLKENGKSDIISDFLEEPYFMYHNNQLEFKFYNPKKNDVKFILFSAKEVVFEMRFEEEAIKQIFQTDDLPVDNYNVKVKTPHNEFSYSFTKN